MRTRLHGSRSLTRPPRRRSHECFVSRGSGVGERRPTEVIDNRVVSDLVTEWSELNIYVCIQDRVIVHELPEYRTWARFERRIESEEDLAVLLDGQMLDMIQPI